MQVIGFNFKKISAEKKEKNNAVSVNTNIQFMDVSKEKVEMLDKDALKILFSFSVSYGDKEKNESQTGEVVMDGEILLSAESEESKQITKEWKKKKIPDGIRIPLLNFIIKRCSAKALSLEEDLGLPYHLPIPQVKPGQNQ